MYCYRTKNPLLDIALHTAMHIPKNSKGEYLYGKRDLFAAMIAVKRLLSNNDYHRMSKEVFRALDTLSKKLNILSLDEILHEMGFPSNWMQLDAALNSAVQPTSED